MSKDRPQCGLILENSQGKILLQLRENKSSIPYPNCWGTFGGQIEKGETPEEAIKREIKEELDYDLKDPVLFGVHPFDGYKTFNFRKLDPKIKLKDLNLNEGQKSAFLSLDQIRKLKCAFNCREIVEDYFKKFHLKESIKKKK